MYKVRKAINKDKEILIDISRRTINSNFRIFMGDEAVDGYIDSGMADEEIISNQENTYVLEINDIIVGLCVWKENLLHLIMIDPEYQKNGAGYYFIEQVTSEKLKKYDDVYLECFENNIEANKFYNKCGWKIYKSEVDDDFGWNKLFYKKQ